MAPETPPPQLSGRNLREYYRITVTLPVAIHLEPDALDMELTEQSVNLSGGGISIIVQTVYQPRETLSVTLLLPDHGRFTASIEVVQLDPLPRASDGYRLRARFVRLSTQDRDVLIRHILRFQRDHLARHYSA